MARTTAKKAAAPSSEQVGDGAQKNATAATDPAAAPAAAPAASAAPAGAGDPSAAPSGNADPADLAATGAGEQVEQSEVVIVGGAWALPVIEDFPATLVLVNATPSARSCPGIGLYMAPGEQCSFEFTDVTFEKFSRYITQIAHLNGWQAGEGMLIEQEADDGED